MSNTWQMGKSVLCGCCSAPLIDSDSQHTHTHTHLTCWQPLLISNLYIIPGISLLISLLPPSLLPSFSPLLISSSLSLVESIFYEAADLSRQAEEEGSWDELLALVRRSRAGGGRVGLMDETENQRAETAMTEQGEAGGIGKCPYLWTIYWSPVWVNIQHQTSGGKRSTEKIEFKHIIKHLSSILSSTKSLPALRLAGHSSPTIWALLTHVASPVTDNQCW